MRDIAGDAGLLAGSIYHHFPSKEVLLHDAYRAGVERVICAHDAAIAGQSDAWNRLEAACEAHLQSLLADDPLARLLSLDLRPLPPELRSKLVAERDRYETRFAAVVGAIGIPAGADERTARMMLLGALNWTPVWYKRGGESPRRISRAFVRLLRKGVS